jgi:hypothetical protein
VVEHLSYRSGGAGTEPVFFNLEKHHGIGDDSCLVEISRLRFLGKVSFLNPLSFEVLV